MRILAGIALALAALAVGAGPAMALPDEPDLVIRLPGEPSGSAVAPVFVDAYEEPGHLLYRFDAVIANQGGTLDLFRGTGGGVEQAVYPGGEPPVAPKPDVTPTGDAVVDRSASGASFAYAYEKTHQHWHFSSAARYSLVVGGGAVRESGKVGFCMFDSFGPSEWFGPSVRGAAGETLVRGQRPGRLDGADGAVAGRRGHLQRPARAPVGRHHGARPGPGGAARGGQPAALRARGELGQQHDERDAGDPGGAGVGCVGRRVGDALGGRGRAVGARAAAGRLRAGAGSKSCYVWASASGPLSFRVVAGACARHGRPRAWGGRAPRRSRPTRRPGARSVTPSRTWRPTRVVLCRSRQRRR